MTHDPREAFQQYRRKQIAELRPWQDGDLMTGISVSAEDRKAGSPKPGDMIARNPKNHADQWLVAEAYFADNFEPLTASPGEQKPVAAVGWNEAGRATVIRLLWEKQFEKSPWADKFHLIRHDSLEADYGALADKIISALRREAPAPEGVVAVHAINGPFASPTRPDAGCGVRLRDHKWFDHECQENGCQSLVWKARYEAAVKGRADFRGALRTERKNSARLREALATVEDLIRRDPACFNLSDELQSVRSAIRHALSPAGDEAKKSEGIAPECKTSPELLALLERAKNHVMSPEEMYEQRRSFARGMCPFDHDYKKWCEEVDRVLPPIEAKQWQ